MQPRTRALASDRPCPMGFLVSAAFLSSLVWLWLLLHQLMTH